MVSQVIMAKIYDDALIFPLKLIFENSFKTGIFPDKQKKYIFIRRRKKNY